MIKFFTFLFAFLFKTGFTAGQAQKRSAADVKSRKGIREYLAEIKSRSESIIQKTRFLTVDNSLFQPPPRPQKESIRNQFKAICSLKKLECTGPSTNFEVSCFPLYYSRKYERDISCYISIRSQIKFPHMKHSVKGVLPFKNVLFNNESF